MIVPERQKTNSESMTAGTSHPGVRFVTMNEMADDFARRSPRVR
jgi:hypothetical protein